MSKFPSERDTLKSKFPRMREEPTDQRLGLPQPPLQKAYAQTACSSIFHRRAKPLPAQ